MDCLKVQHPNPSPPPQASCENIARATTMATQSQDGKWEESQSLDLSSSWQQHQQQQQWQGSAEPLEDASTVSFFIQDTHSCEGISLQGATYWNWEEEEIEIEKEGALNEKGMEELKSGGGGNLKTKDNIEGTCTGRSASSMQSVPPNYLEGIGTFDDDGYNNNKPCKEETKQIPKCITLKSIKHAALPSVDSTHYREECRGNNSKSDEKDESFACCQLLVKEEETIETLIPNCDGPSPSLLVPLLPVTEDTGPFENSETERKNNDTSKHNNASKRNEDISDHSTIDIREKEINDKCQMESLTASLCPTRTKNSSMKSTGKQNTPDIIVLDDDSSCSSNGNELAAIRIRSQSRMKRKRQDIGNVFRSPKGADLAIDLCDSPNNDINLCGSSSEDEDCCVIVHNRNTAKPIKPTSKKRSVNVGVYVGKGKSETSHASPTINLDSSDDECFFENLPSSGFKRVRNSFNESRNSTRRAKKSRLNTFPSILSKKDSPFGTVTSLVKDGHNGMKRIIGRISHGALSPQLSYRAKRDVLPSQEIIEIDSD